MSCNIKELAKRSGMTSVDVPYLLSDYDLYDYPQVEEFAKLIVQECLDVINNIDEDDDKERGLFAASWGIRKHFEKA